MRMSTLFVLVVLSSIFVSGISTTLAGDGSPICDLSYEDDDGDGLGTIPNCGATWTQTVEADYIMPAMSEMGMAHMSWTNTSIGNPITRIFQGERIDLSGGGGHLEYAPFEGDYLYYAVGGRIMWGPGAAVHTCGFYLRSTGRAFYTVLIGQDGSVHLEELDAGIWRPSRLVRTANLNTGAGATNTLMVMVLRDFFHVFVNGERVARFNDSTNMDTYGGAGIWADTFNDNAGSYCLFEQAWIWPIDNWEWE